MLKVFEILEVINSQKIMNALGYFFTVFESTKQHIVENKQEIVTKIYF